MSIDIHYYSFSPSRADSEWPYFIEDITVLRKAHAPWEEFARAEETYEEKWKKTEAQYEVRLAEVRKKIYEHFGAKGLMIPWVEWDQEQGTNKHGAPVTMRDNDKMEYLLAYGCVYPKGADLSQKGVPCVMLRTDAPELEEEYNRLIEERNRAQVDLCAPSNSLPMKDKTVVLNDRQEGIERNAHISYLTYDNQSNRQQLIRDLEFMDLYYGSAQSIYLEDGKIEYAVMQALAEVFKLHMEHEYPPRDEWVRLFENITKERVHEVGTRLMKEFQWESDEAEWAAIEFLQQVRPLAKDMKETPDAVFVSVVNDEIASEQGSAARLLRERAERHAEQYKGQLPPVL